MPRCHSTIPRVQKVHLATTVAAEEVVEEVVEGFDTAPGHACEPCYTPRVQLVPAELPCDPGEF